MKKSPFAVSIATAVLVGLTLAGCSGESHRGDRAGAGSDGSSEDSNSGSSKAVVGKAVEVDLTKDAVTKANLTLTDTDFGDKVEVKRISTKFKPDNLTSFKSSEGDIVMVQLKVTVPDDGFSVTNYDFGSKDDQGTTSSNIYAGGLDAAMESQNFKALPDYVGKGDTATGWVPVQVLDTAKSVQLTWKRQEQEDYSSKKTFPSKTLSAPLFTNTGASAAVKAAKEGATAKKASASSTDDVTQNTVTVDQIITDFPLPKSLDYETGHIVAVHINASAGSVYTSGWAVSDLQLITSEGDKVDHYSNSDAATALAEQGFTGLSEDGYISSGESTTGWVPFLVKSSTGDDGFTISQHRDAANIIGGGSVPAADFPAKITIG